MTRHGAVYLPQSSMRETLASSHVHGAVRVWKQLFCIKACQTSTPSLAICFSNLNNHAVTAVGLPLCELIDNAGFPHVLDDTSAKSHTWPKWKVICDAP